MRFPSRQSANRTLGRDFPTILPEHEGTFGRCAWHGQETMRQQMGEKPLRPLLLSTVYCLLSTSFVFLLSTVYCLLSTSSYASDWPQWRGPERSGVSKETGLLKSWPKDGPLLVWTYTETGVG